MAQLYDILDEIEEVTKQATILSARQCVLQRVWRRTPDAAMQHTLLALQVPTVELERMAATLMAMLIAQEQQTDE